MDKIEVIGLFNHQHPSVSLAPLPSLVVGCYLFTPSISRCTIGLNSESLHLDQLAYQSLRIQSAKAFAQEGE